MEYRSSNMKKTYKKVLTGLIISIAFTALSVSLVSCKEPKKKVVKVGLLHSLTGTMSISEVAVRDAELLAIKEINEAGGILGCQIKIIVPSLQTLLVKTNQRIVASGLRILLDVCIRIHGMVRHIRSSHITSIAMAGIELV